MSKAIQWARALREARNRLDGILRDEVPAFHLADGSSTPTAWVDEDGKPYFEKVHGKWETEHALALAEWIIDTFGDVDRR